MRRRLVAPFFAILFFGTVVNMQSISPLTLEISRDLGVSVAQAGNLVGAMTAVGLLAAPFLGPLSDRWGRRPVLLAGLLVQGLTAIACLFVEEYRTLLVLRMVSGLGQATNMTAGQAAVGDLYPPEERSVALSTFLGYMGLGSVIGIPLVAVTGDYLGWRVALALLGGMFLTTFTLGCLALPAGRQASTQASAGYLEVFRSYRESSSFLYVLAGQFFSNAGAFAIITYLGALYGKVYGLSPAQSAWLFGLNGLFYFAGGLLAGRLVPRFGIRRIVLAGGVAAALSVLLLGTWHPGKILMAGVVCAFGLGRAGTYGPLSAMAQEVVPWARGAMASLNSLATYLGMSAGSLLGGVALTWGGWPGWGFVGALCFLTVSICMLRVPSAAAGGTGARIA